MAGLDTLRGVAIMAVIAFHVGLAFPQGGLLGSAVLLGYNGVQLFFIVSAITMCYMWNQRRDEYAPVRSFFIRRLCRIAPPFWFAIAFYVAWRRLVVGGGDHDDFFGIVSTALFVHGFFPSTINKVVPGGWSIAAEVSFYMLFPILVAVLTTARRRLVGALCTYIVCTVAASLVWLRFGPPLEIFLYYSLLTQLPVFLVGMLVYSLRVRGERLRLALAVAIGLTWLLVALACRARGLPGRPFLWVEVGAMAAASAALLGRFDIRPLAFLGRLSYSAYLFHFAVIDVLVLAVSPEQRHGTMAFLLALVATSLLTTGVAWASSKTIEAWSMTLGRHLVRRLQPVAPAAPA